MSPSRTPRRNPVAWVVAGILLIVAVLASFWVPIYARSTPKLGALPFFYWYQLLMVPAVAIVSWIAYLLVRSAGPATSSQAAAGPAPAPPPGTGPAGGGPVGDGTAGSGTAGSGTVANGTGATA
jgi:hypothetical protein